MDDTSGVGVIDKSVAILDAVSRGANSLADLVAATGFSRPTAYRLAVALETHRLLARDADGRFVLGTRLASWTGESDALVLRAQPIVVELRDLTGLSAQVYRRQGPDRLCLAAAEPTSGLRDGVPVGALLTMSAGSAAQILCAWLPEPERIAALKASAFDDEDLTRCRTSGWAHSIGQREPGVASISAPVRNRHEVIAALSMSGPAERLRKPSRAHVAALLEAAEALSENDEGPP